MGKPHRLYREDGRNDDVEVDKGQNGCGDG